MLISTILLHLTTHSESITIDGQKVNQEKRLTDSLLSTIAAICQMDPSLQSNVASSRIIMVGCKFLMMISLSHNGVLPQFFIFLAFSLLYAAYTANIVSLLQSPSKNIRTLLDLYNSKLALGIEDTPYNRFFFRSATDPLEIKVFREKLAPPGQKERFMKAEVGIAMVRKGLFAFIMEDSRAYKIMEDTYLEHEKCDLTRVQFLNIAHPFLCIKKKSPYKEILKVK